MSTPTVTLTKVLWASLTGCLTLIVLLVSAWASNVSSRAILNEQRIGTDEQHYAAIQADLQSLREDVRELKEMLRTSPQTAKQR